LETGRFHTDFRDFRLVYSGTDCLGAAPDLDSGPETWQFALFPDHPICCFPTSNGNHDFHSFLRGIPFELEEAANIDGAGTFRTFVEIIVPIVKPAIATVSIFVFLSSWNEFTMALILISEDRLKTLPLGLLNFQGAFNTDWGAMGAALMISSLPTILFYLFFSNQVEKAMGVSGAVNDGLIRGSLRQVPAAAGIARFNAPIATSCVYQGGKGHLIMDGCGL